MTTNNLIAGGLILCWCVYGGSRDLGGFGIVIKKYYLFKN
jgi:hypothetical protein